MKRKILLAIFIITLLAILPYPKRNETLDYIINNRDNFTSFDIYNNRSKTLVGRIDDIAKVRSFFQAIDGVKYDFKSHLIAYGSIRSPQEFKLKIYSANQEVTEIFLIKSRSSIKVKGIGDFKVKNYNQLESLVADMANSLKSQ